METDQDLQYERALNLIVDGRYTAAASVMQSVVDSAPRAAQSVYLLGVIRLLEGRLVESRKLIDRAFTIKRWIKDFSAETADLQSAARDAAGSMPDWTWPRYEIERHGYSAIGMTLRPAINVKLAHCDVFFIQVGANDGLSGDPIHGFIKEHEWSGVCVEPQPEVFDALQRTYADNDRIRFAQVAISDDEGVKPMYLAAGGRSTIGSLMRDRNILAKEANIQTVDVDCVSFTRLCDEMQIDRVDLLQIDTEGADYAVLRSFDIERYRPAVINLELFCLPLDERLACFALLREHGYAYRYDGRDLLAVDRSVYEDELCIVDHTGGRFLT